MLFSVIIPCRNSTVTLGDAIRSIQRQTYKDFEIIIIDDFSTIPIPQVPGVILLRNEVNLGAGLSRQIGLTAASGEFVLFLDADDTFNNPYVLDQFRKAAERVESDVIRSVYLEIGNDYIVAVPTKATSTVSGNAYRRQFLLDNKVKFQPLKLCEDSLFNRKILQCNPRVNDLNVVSFDYNVKTPHFVDRYSEALEWIIRAAMHLHTFVYDRDPLRAAILATKSSAFHYFYFEGLRQAKRLSASAEEKIIQLFKNFEELTGAIRCLETDPDYLIVLKSSLAEEANAAAGFTKVDVAPDGLIPFYRSILDKTLNIKLD